MLSGSSCHGVFRRERPPLAPLSSQPVPPPGFEPGIRHATSRLLALSSPRHRGPHENGNRCRSKGFSLIPAGPSGREDRLPSGPVDVTALGCRSRAAGGNRTLTARVQTGGSTIELQRRVGGEDGALRHHNRPPVRGTRARVFAGHIWRRSVRRRPSPALQSGRREASVSQAIGGTRPAAEPFSTRAACHTSLWSSGHRSPCSAVAFRRALASSVGQYPKSPEPRGLRGEAAGSSVKEGAVFRPMVDAPGPFGGTGIASKPRSRPAHFLAKQNPSARLETSKEEPARGLRAGVGEGSTFPVIPYRAGHLSHISHSEAMGKG